jgi:SAM-dependent methyltransferase
MRSMVLLRSTKRGGVLGKAGSGPTYPLMAGRVRALSTAPPKFDENMARIYAHIANQHFHENGPWPAMLATVKEHLSRNPTGRVLDIATGPGQPGISIAQIFPEADVILSDVSEDMLTKAKDNSKDVPNAMTVIADAENLQYGDNEFDVVSCCYGYMFCEDKAKALRESYRVLKPGGVLVATTWDKLEFLNLTKDIMRDVLGESPPAPALNPMSMHEPGMMEGLVEGAGFKDMKVAHSSYPFDMSSDPKFQYDMVTILVKDKIAELGAEDVAKKAFEKYVSNYGKYGADRELLVEGNTFKLTVATK